MLVLAIDSAGPACAVCIWHDGRVLAQNHMAMERGQDSQLMPMILLTVAQADLVFSAFDKIAVTRGPGSFTGVRVGLAAARGIGLAAQKPVIGIDRFAIYHELHASAHHDLLIVIDSKRFEFFCQFFQRAGVPEAPRLMTEAEIEAFIESHPGTRIVGDKATPNDPVIEVCAKLAAELDGSRQEHAPQPLYLRAPDVTLPDGTPSSATSL